MYRKFDVTGNLFFLHSAFFEELNTAQKKKTRQSAVWLADGCRRRRGGDETRLRCGRCTRIQAWFRLKRESVKFGTVALSFVFDNYCLIMD
jgi:hypothetical protein